MCYTVPLCGHKIAVLFALQYTKCAIQCHCVGIKWQYCVHYNIPNVLYNAIVWALNGNTVGITIYQMCCTMPLCGHKMAVLCALQYTKCAVQCHCVGIKWQYCGHYNIPNVLCNAIVWALNGNTVCITIYQMCCTMPLCVHKMAVLWALQYTKCAVQCHCVGIKWQYCGHYNIPNVLYNAIVWA